MQKSKWDGQTETDSRTVKGNTQCPIAYGRDIQISVFFQSFVTYFFQLKLTFIKGKKALQQFQFIQTQRVSVTTISLEFILIIVIIVLYCRIKKFEICIRKFTFMTTNMNEPIHLKKDCHKLTLSYKRYIIHLYIQGI